MSDLTWTNETRRLGDLKPQEDNPRLIREKQAERLNESWDEYGQVDLLAVGPDGEIYNGHQRYYVLLDRHGPDHPVECRIASRPLERREWQRLTVLLHEGAVGEWDFDGLANWEGVDFSDLVEWGFDAEKLGVVIEQEPPADPGPQIDRAEELREKWGTERGQIWQIGKHRLMCGDSLEMDWSDVTLLLTDPPYGINVVQGLRASDGGSKAVTIGSVRPRRTDTVGGVKNLRGTVGATNLVDATLYRPVEGDDKPFDPTWLLSIGANQIIFGGNYFASKLPDSRCWIVWDKNNTGNFADAELAWTSFDRSIRLYEFTWNGLLREGSRQIEGMRRMHPTQKPAGLFAEILTDFSQEADIVGDPYVGSGTTLVSCEITDRQGIAAEIEPAYVAVTLERMAGMGLEPKLVEQ